MRAEWGITSYIPGSSHIHQENSNRADFGLCTMFLKILSKVTFCYSYMSMFTSIVGCGIWQPGQQDSKTLKGTQMALSIKGK